MLRIPLPSMHTAAVICRAQPSPCSGLHDAYCQPAFTLRGLASRVGQAARIRRLLWKRDFGSHPECGLLLSLKMHN